MAIAADCCKTYKLKTAVINRTMYITKMYSNRRELKLLLAALKALSDS
jgi:hypothetical protein